MRSATAQASAGNPRSISGEPFDNVTRIPDFRDAGWRRNQANFGGGGDATR
ncbi:hypothetical protein ACIBVL_14985 [Streptomyces sp. NPDC049687]|uniref:hypothetical protein n=1 Tax=Streptomyces sp. NPDC049687 TaxID=3365596 RepID=UPI0037B426B1